MSEQRFWCRSCGMVRDSDTAPWCRHGDPVGPTPAARMEPLPSWHPCADSSDVLSAVERQDAA